MPNNYLAMYLSVRFDFATVWAPIRLFAENILRLEDDIRNAAYFTTINEADDASERIQTHSNSRQVCVLLDSSLAGREAILKPYGHNQAHSNMAKIQAEAAKLYPSASLRRPSVEVLLQIWYGIKNANTAYPTGIVGPQNFESDVHLVQMGNVQLSQSPNYPAAANGALFWTLVFHDPRGQVFFVRL